MKIRRCIISYASIGRENYPEGFKRLIPSALRNGHGTDRDSAIMLISPDIDVDEIAGVKINRFNPVVMPLHREVPYAFKPWIFNMAFNFGFRQVLWCDSTIIIHKPLEPIWDIAAQHGACAFDNPGCPQSFYTSDDAADKMGCPRDAMFDQIMACAMAFDIGHSTGVKAFKRWFALSQDGVTFHGKSGSSRPEFKAHRHDQSAMSWIAHDMGIPLQPYGLLCYACDREKFPQHVLANTGIG